MNNLLYVLNRDYSLFSFSTYMNNYATGFSVEIFCSKPISISLGFKDWQVELPCSINKTINIICICVIIYNVYVAKQYYKFFSE